MRWHGMQRPESMSAGRRERRVLLLRPGALGDALLVIPALAAIRAQMPDAQMPDVQMPDAQIGLITRRDVLPLLHASRLVDASLPYDDARVGWLFSRRHADGAPRELAALASGADAVAWLTDPQGAVATNLRALGARQVSIGPARPAGGAHEHMALTLLRGLEQLSISLPKTVPSLVDRLPHLTVADADTSAAQRVWRELRIPDGARVIALHPGSGGASKRWPPDNWTGLIVALRGHDFYPLMIEGPQDTDLVAACVAHLAPDMRPPIARGLRVGALLAALRRCVAYAGNDSGVSHLAALGGVPTLALFGPTNPAIWSPLGRRVSILRSPAGHLADIAPDDACRALMELAATPAP